MRRETIASTPHMSPLYYVSASNIPNAIRSSAKGAMSPFAIGFLRRGSAEHLETLFSRLKDGALLIAALSYGLEVTTSDICSIRIRDVHIASQSVVIKMRAYRIPKMVLDDLKEYLQDKVCGYEASASLSKRDNPLFSEAERSVLQHEVASWWQIFKVTQADRQGLEVSQPLQRPRGASATGTDVCVGTFDRALPLLGRSHRLQAARRGMEIPSALELFNKGPRIVRRTRAGAVAAYYVWRTRVPSILPLSKR